MTELREWQDLINYDTRVDRMKQIMVRSGKDSFEAMLIGNAMINSGANIISISYGPEAGAYMTYSVFAEVGGDDHISRIDSAIEKALDE
jgi:hypothetical protein